MKFKLLILSALAALVCVSCEKNEAYESSSVGEISENADIPKNVDEVNTVDEEATEKGNTPAYEIYVKKTDKNGKINEHTEIKNCFDDILSTDQFMDMVYEYKYNSDGLMLEEKSSMAFGDDPIETLNTYKYDEHGEMTLFHTVQGAIGAFEGDESECIYKNEYNDAGRLIRTEYSDTYYNDENDEEEVSVTVTEFKYDSKGNVSEMIVDSAVLGKRKTVIEYDSRGNRISELETVIKDGEEKRGLDIYTTYNSHDLPETQDWFRNDELVWHYEFEYTFYNE